jgi:type II secretory pathway component PulF
MLGRVADYYDRELPGKVQRIFASLYPVAVLTLGSLILFMGLGILLPIYASATGVQR